jgi:heterodisulfide reductase subunit A
MNAENNKKAVLVLGAGVGGIKAALDLAESGFQVYLCDRSPDIGGTLMQMDKWFPDSHCGLCKMLPVMIGDESAQFCLRRGLNHPNIEFLPLTQLEKLEGEAGNFTATLKTRPMGVNRDICSGCGQCTQVCPVEVASEFNEGLDKRKAIYIRHPLVAANAYLIDWDNCTRCGACAEVCPTKAINLDEQDEERKIEIGAVVLSTGFEEFNAKLTTQYGYQRWANVVTNIQFERILSPGGPFQGKLVRPSDGKTPSSIAFLQCVGSRELQRNYCSSACCMYALKEAILAKEANPDIDVTIFYMDIRAFGKDSYKYYLEAKNKYGVKFIRSRVPVIKEDAETGNIIFISKAEDGKQVKNQFELVVLSVGQVPPPQFTELSRTLGIELNKFGFCQTGEFSPVETSREGIYACGSTSAPKDIAETLMEAGAAACQVSKLLTPVSYQPVSIQEGELSEEEPHTAIFICGCGEEISSVVDIEQLVTFSKNLPGVVHAVESPYLCQKDMLDKLIDEINTIKANCVIFAACSPSILGRVVNSAMQEAGLSQLFTQYINLREGVAWVHKEQPEAATEKAKSLLAMAAERARLQKRTIAVSSDIKRGALIIGGGLGGLVSALNIAEQGYEVYLIEKSSELGGNLRHIHNTLEGNNPQELLDILIRSVEASPLIHIYKETEVVKFEGYAGNFEVTLKNKEEEIPLLLGAVIVATGGREYQPEEYSYGQSDRIVTQREMEEKLDSGELNAEDIKTAVMIQCVGSRNEQRPYCSRICCSQALKNALRLKQLNPQAQIFVLYRDMMSFGFMEEYYTHAREAGIIFIRYDLDEKPQVRLEQEALKVEVKEPAIGEKLLLEPDILVLSPAVLPQDSNQELAQLLGVDLTDEGFFKEAEVKFRPVDFSKDGIYACGIALSPRNIGEVIANAQAAAQRAVTLLSKEQLYPSAVVAEVNERWCTGCELCVQACPYGARVKDKDKGVVIVREALCYGCGACVAACPSGAAKLRRFTNKQILSMIDAGL